METVLRKRKSQKMEQNLRAGKLFVNDRRYSGDSLPNSLGYVVLVLFLVFIKFFSYMGNSLPNQIKLKDAGSNPDRFIGERAELQLKRLTDIGTRVVGSYENEVLAVDFLKREISFISQETQDCHQIEIDIQKPTGSYYLGFKPHGFRNYYANIQNVVVKLSSSNTTNSILLNCHYDTVPESPGASDNGLNCVVMLEILRLMATSKTPLKNNIIFLFNGAEENPLQASHGFLSQHKWRNEVKVFINLDSGGAGGKEILFQTSGDPWLVKMYAKSVPRPTAGVQAEELFQFGIIPSDTDFRIFRDFGKYQGFDFAHCTNGYVYHTKYDRMEFIRPGVYQHTGDNILALTRELAQASELKTENSRTRLVYFDFFELFVVVYTESWGIGLSLLTLALSFWSSYKTLKVLPGRAPLSVKNLSLSVGGQLLALSLAGGVVLFLSKTLDYYKSTMSWYLRPWLIIPLYSFPVVVAMVAMLLLVQTLMEKDLPGHKVIRFINGAQLLWSFILLLAIFKGVRSSFMLMLILLPSSLGSLLLVSSKTNFTAKMYLVVYFSCLLVPFLFILQQVVRVFTTIIPMTARMGPHTNPEMIIGALALISLAVFLSYIVPLLLLLRKLKNFMIVLLSIHIFTMAVIVGTRFGFPYDGDVTNPALQRFYVMHTERTFYDSKGSVRRADSGFFVQSMDRNNVNYLTEIVPDFKKAISTSDDCSTELYCGFPVFTSRFIRPASFSYWIPAPPPTIHHPTSLEVVNQTQMSVLVRRVRILITGPDHISVAISPRKNVKLLKWSFEELEPEKSQDWEDRNIYMVYYSHGLMGGTLEFDVDLQVETNQTDLVMDIAVVGHYMHDKKFRTKEFSELLLKFPDWTHITPWTATYKSWKI